MIINERPIIVHPTMKPNNRQNRTLWNWLQDIGYGIASMFGQGENADKFMNGIATRFGDEKHLNSTELINMIKSYIGDKPQKLNKVLNLIDRKLSQLDTNAANLPPTFSNEMKKVIRSERAKISSQRGDILRDRAKVASDLTKVEQTMNQSLSMAGMQDTYVPTRKVENQHAIKELLESSPDTDFSTIERKL